MDNNISIMFVIDNNNSRFFDKFYPSKLKTLQQNLNQNRRRGLCQTVRELLYPAINVYPLYRDFRKIVRNTTLIRQGPLSRCHRLTSMHSVL